MEEVAGMDLSLEYCRGLTGLHWRDVGFGDMAVNIEDLHFDWEWESARHLPGVMRTLAVFGHDYNLVFKEDHSVDHQMEDNIRAWQRWLECI
jgi:hypothetical protein